jgi:hypothetical protein
LGNNKTPNQSMECNVLIKKLFWIVKASNSILNKWNKQLISRFYQNFEYLLPSENENLKNMVNSLMKVSKSFFKLSANFIKEHVMEKDKDRRNLESKIETDDENNIYIVNKQEANYSEKRIKRENYLFFEKFVINQFFKKDNLNVFDKNLKFDAFLVKTQNEIKNINSASKILSIFNLIQNKIETQIASSAKDNIGCFESGVFSDKKTISYKRMHQTKLNESKDIDSIKKTVQKKHYDSNIYQMGKFDNENNKKVIIESPKNSDKSICSDKMHVETYNQQHRLKKSMLMKDMKSIDDRESQNNAFSNMTSPKIKQNLIKQIPVSNTKSYTSNIFKNSVPKMNLMHSQNFKQKTSSKKTLGLPDSKLLMQSKMDSHLYSELKESPQLIIQKKKNRKQMIEFPVKNTHQHSPSINFVDPSNNYSIEMRNTIESRDMSSLDKNRTSDINPFAFVSDVYSQTKLPQFLNTKQNGKFKTIQNPSHVSLINPSETESKRITNKDKKQRKKMLSKIVKGHQKFSSVNLEYLRLQNAKKLKPVRQSQISNKIEENEKMLDIISQIKKKESYLKNNGLKETSKSKGLARMKSLVSKNSSKNYKNIISSYMAKNKALKRVKSKAKKKSKISSKKNHFKTDSITTSMMKSIKTGKKVADSEVFNRRSTYNFNNTSIIPQKIGKKKSERIIAGMRIINPQRVPNNRKKSKKPRNQMRSIHLGDRKMSKHENKKNLLNKKLIQTSGVQGKNIRASRVKKTSISKKIKNLSYFLGTKTSEISDKKKIGSISKNYKKAYRFKLKKVDKDLMIKKKKSGTKKDLKMSSSLVHKMKAKLLTNSGEIVPDKNRKNLKYYFSYLDANGRKEMKKQRKQRERKKVIKELTKTQVI